jgi:hypothetical protein
MTIQGEQARIVVEHRLGVRLPRGIVVERCVSQTSFRDSLVFAKLIGKPQALDDLFASLPETETFDAHREVVAPTNLPWFALPEGTLEKSVHRGGHRWLDLHMGKVVDGRRTVLLRASGGVPSP